MSKVERRHREAAAVALSAGPKLSTYVVDWIAGGPAPASVWSSVAQAIATAEHRGASARALELADAWDAGQQAYHDMLMGKPAVENPYRAAHPELPEEPEGTI